MKQTTILPDTPIHALYTAILKVCHKVPLKRHCNHFGPKIFLECQKVALTILFHRSGKSLRDFIAQLKELRWVKWLQLKELPSKSTLHNWIKQYPLSFTRKLNAFLLDEEQPQLMAIDGTGVDSWQRSRHYEKRLGEAPMPYAKLDLFVDADSLLIHDHVLRTKPRHDTIAAHSMFRRTKHRGVLILGDKGYDREPLHREAKRKGNILFAPVRGHVRRKIRGFNRKRCAAGHPDYSKRNGIESVNHAFKARRMNALRSKLPYIKKRELAWHVLIYNLERLIKVSRIFFGVWLSMILDRPY